MAARLRAAVPTAPSPSVGPAPWAPLCCRWTGDPDAGHGTWPASGSEALGASPPQPGILGLRVAGLGLLWTGRNLRRSGQPDTTAVPRLAIHFPHDRGHLLTEGAAGEGLGAPATQTPTDAQRACPLLSLQNLRLQNQALLTRPLPRAPSQPSAHLGGPAAAVPSTCSTLPTSSSGSLHASFPPLLKVRFLQEAFPEPQTR